MIFKFFLYLKLLWHHIVFYFYPTPEEYYYTNIGTIYYDLGKFNKAIEMLSKSEKAHNKEASFIKYNSYYLGHSYLNLGNHQKAGEHFKKYLTFNPEDLHAISIIKECERGISGQRNWFKIPKTNIDLNK